jgi:hypothetical protein
MDILADAVLGISALAIVLFLLRGVVGWICGLALEFGGPVVLLGVVGFAFVGCFYRGDLAGWSLILWVACSVVTFGLGCVLVISALRGG